MSTDVRVLLGDSSPSELPSNILDTIVELCLCARDVAVAHVEISAHWKELDEAEYSFAEIAEQLQKFRRVGESGLLASVEEATRAEMKEHGHQAADALGRMVDGWLAQYQGARDARVADLRRKIEALHQRMSASLDRFALPLRAQPLRRVIRRKLEGTRYSDHSTLELLPGLRVNLTLEDTELEQPRRLRSLLGKGAKLQVGTKKALLRRTEEPAYVALDDLVIFSAEITPDAVKLELGKKPGGPLVLRVAMSASGDRLEGRGVLPDGSGNPLIEDDRPVFAALWSAIHNEADRIIASPARSEGYALRDEVVETPAGFVNVIERMVEHYRPAIGTIMDHSPNREELTVKVEVGDRREEKWIRREDLAANLSRVPPAFQHRLCIPEIVKPTGALEPQAGAMTVDAPRTSEPSDPAEARPRNADARPDAAAPSRAGPPPPPPAGTEPAEYKATAAYARVPTIEELADMLDPNGALPEGGLSDEKNDLPAVEGEPTELPDVDTQDISLTDLEVEPEESSGGLPMPDLDAAKPEVDKPKPPKSLRVKPKPRAPVKKPPLPGGLRRKTKS